MQKTNSFIFSSKSIHKRYLYFALFFYFSFLISFILFLIKPSIFYWRAWEYFDEVSYRIPNKLKWEGYEFGDAARVYIYSFQDKWKTIASADDEGFRSVPFQAEKFPILIVGDSHTWGTGLNDDETIPWKVATQLNLPVFNGARRPFTLSKILNNPRLKEAKVIVELLNQNLVNKRIFENSDFETPGYQVYAKEKSWTNYFEISPNRFFIPLKLIRSMFLKLNIFNEITRSQLDNYRIPFKKTMSMQCSDEDFEFGVQKIIERAQLLESLGYQYVVGLVPGKDMQLAYHQDPIDARHETEIAKILKTAGVHYIDFCEAFKNSENPKLLFFQTDCHINSVGAKVIANKIADYLSLNFKDILSPPYR